MPLVIARGSVTLCPLHGTVKNANMYEGRAKPANGDWLPSIFGGDSRRIAFVGLTAGTTYTIEVRAVGGSTGQSDWSDPSSHVAL